MSNAGRIIENLLQLTLLYTGIFLIQVIVLPVALFWLLARMINGFFSIGLPGLFKSSRRPGGGPPEPAHGAFPGR